MRVFDIQVLPGEDYCELQARVESDAPPEHHAWFAPFTLWYRFPARYLPYLDVNNGDPFLAALLFPAMRLDERLHISVPISPRLLQAVPEIQSIYTCFDPATTRIPLEVTARETLAPGASDAAVGLFFSLGVDSFYSLLKNRRDHPRDDQSVTHLISLHGIDVMHHGWDERFPPALLDNMRRVEAETGTTLVPVVTNVRRYGARMAPWTMLHGGALASVALALQGFLGRVSIAASTTYDMLFPWGTHPLLDPLWSTERLTVVHDGCETDSIDKTHIIAHSPLVLDTLRPCPGYGDGTYNCGQCRKCMRTMVDLWQAGYLDSCRTLPHEIDPTHLRRALGPGGGPRYVPTWQRRLETFVLTGAPPGVIEAISDGLPLGGENRAQAASSRSGRISRWLRAFGSATRARPTTHTAGPIEKRCSRGSRCHALPRCHRA
jgi:hypothetical protein